MCECLRQVFEGERRAGNVSLPYKDPPRLCAHRKLSAYDGFEHCFLYACSADGRPALHGANQHVVGFPSVVLFGSQLVGQRVLPECGESLFDERAAFRGKTAGDDVVDNREDGMHVIVDVSAKLEWSVGLERRPRSRIPLRTFPRASVLVEHACLGVQLVSSEKLHRWVVLNLYDGAHAGRVPEHRITHAYLVERQI